MRSNHLKEMCQRREAAVNGWLTIASPYAAEVMGHQGFDAVTVDMQHGMIGFAQAVGMFQALSATPALPLARVSCNDPALLMQMLDAGAYGIICPMISSVEEARSFVSACRYPPLGTRSFGPTRGLLYGGPDYFQRANHEILTLAMIETRAGLDALEAILAVDGLDGVFVGPNDLSLAMGKAPKSEPDDKEVRDAIVHICARTLADGKIPGIFCSGGDAAARRIAEGFLLVTPGTDVALLSQAARRAVDAARNQNSSARPAGAGY
ncbi:MAG: HpcH/HpaI aldolase family protein [Polaromonas sp.]